MDVKELVNAIHIVELSATTRSNAIRELVDAVNWAHENVLPDDVVKAIEEREATAQTIVDKGLALPHAMIEWTGDFRLVLGRSQAGVDYVAKSDKLHLIVLLVVGKGRERMHLEVLAAVAELLNDDDFRRTLVKADHARDIKPLLVERAGQQPQRRPQPVEIPRRSVAVVRHAVGLAESLSAQALLLAIDQGQSVPWEPLKTGQGVCWLSPLRTATRAFLTEPTRTCSTCRMPVSPAWTGRTWACYWQPPTDWSTTSEKSSASPDRVDKPWTALR